VQFSAVQSSAVQCSAVQCSAVKGRPNGGWGLRGNGARCGQDYRLCTLGEGWGNPILPWVGRQHLARQNGSTSGFEQTNRWPGSGGLDIYLLFATCGHSTLGSSNPKCTTFVSALNQCSVQPASHCICVRCACGGAACIASGKLRHPRCAACIALHLRSENAAVTGAALPAACLAAGRGVTGRNAAPPAQPFPQLDLPTGGALFIPGSTTLSHCQIGRIKDIYV
jgi:hypothetical protein